jgi:hypothetical protein
VHCNWLLCSPRSKFIPLITHPYRFQCLIGFMPSFFVFFIFKVYRQKIEGGSTQASRFSRADAQASRFLGNMFPTLGTCFPMFPKQGGMGKPLFGKHAPHIGDTFPHAFPHVSPKGGVRKRFVRCPQVSGAWEARGAQPKPWGTCHCRILKISSTLTCSLSI